MSTPDSPLLQGSSLRAFSFPGTYADEEGSETIQWQVLPSGRRGPLPGFELHTVIRGIEFRGYDFDALEPVDRLAAKRAGVGLQSSGDLGNCAVSGALPCTIETEGHRSVGVIQFSLDLTPPSGSSVSSPKNLHLAMRIGGTTVEVDDEWFEDGVQHIKAALPVGVRLTCCLTCVFSDYSPAGHGLLGMSCRRAAKEQYLTVKSKLDYFKVPVTEVVMETHLCPEYQRRVPGTGYRG